jgi:polysaccharide biosynthesis/export protein
MRVGKFSLRRRIAMVAVVSLFAAQGLVAQITRSTLFEQTPDVKSRIALPSGADVQPSGVALQSTIDAATYFVGPSDVIGVNIWIVPPVNLSLTVTPEGTLIIPGTGQVSVGGIPLAEAKERILAKVRRKYSGGEVNVTLLRPRPIVVEVVGYVLNPGLQTLTAADRANRAIEMANAVLNTQSSKTTAPPPEGMSARGVFVKHRDGTRERVDLILARSSAGDRLNPYLREGDVIIVPERNPRRNVFGIYGEVNLPARYEYADGDSVLDALNIAQGFTPLAWRDSVELTRMDSSGGIRFTQTINLDAIAKRTAPNLALQPGDRIVVKSHPDLRRDYRVSIVGEVRYPGTYPITLDRTRVSEIVARAGGFTKNAALKTSELLRPSVEPAELDMERLESLRGGVAPEDSSYYYLETDLRIKKEVVGMDFERLFLRGDSTQDMILHDNDRINVPSLKRTVYVFGQVVTPGHLPFVPGKDVEYYVDGAGGFTERAQTGDLKIVKAKTRQWLSPDETTIEDGDYVWVPKTHEYTFGYYMNIIGQTASILSAAVSIVLLVVQINK